MSEKKKDVPNIFITLKLPPSRRDEDDGQYWKRPPKKTKPVKRVIEYIHVKL